MDATLVAMSRGSFFGVRTTGVFCRPGCASRTPRPENVVWFETCEKARRSWWSARAG
jgi:AraC family transcriptional regulator of adaptative response/methylated-DNA-[protein]-cysteine methyltransferase